MQRKKQISVTILLFVLLVFSLCSWFLVKHEELKATQSPKTSGREVYNIPEPAKINTVNLGVNYQFWEDAGQVTKNIVNKVSYPWYNVVQMVEQTPSGQGAVGQKGALWYKDKISIEKEFKGEFETYLGNEKRVVYDGISFTFQNDPKGLNAIGASGNGFGVSANGIYQTSYVKNAISIIVDAGDNSIYAVVPQAWSGSSQSGGIRSLIRYNYHKLSFSDFGYLSNGVWQHFSYEWKDEVLSYIVTFKNAAGKEMKFTDSINFKTGDTSSEWVNEVSTQDHYPNLHPKGKKIVEIEELIKKGNYKGAETYFGGKSVFWGYTGTSYGSGSQAADGDKAIAPLVCVESTPNQSQSPLVLSMKKYGNADGTKQPLSGAKFILQAENQEGKWQQFDPEPLLKPTPEKFETNIAGEIKIQAENGTEKEANLIEMVLKYGGRPDGDYQAFRFREVEAPAGYVQPPAINPTGVEEANSATGFTTKSIKLDGNSTTNAGDFGEVYNTLRYHLEQVKVPTKTYPAGIVDLDQGQWQELFGNGEMIAVKEVGNDQPLAYLDQTTYTFEPKLDRTQTPWNSTVGKDRTFKVTITPTQDLLNKFPGLQSIVADAKLTFIGDAYTLQVMICKPGQDGKVGEVVSFDSSIDHPFKLQDDISKGIGDDAWPYEGSFLDTDRKIVVFPDCTFEWEIKYRVKQTATPNANLALWDEDNGSMTKPFSFKDGEIPTLTVFNGDDGGDPREYFLGYEGDTYPINRDDAPATATWFAKYDRSTKVLTFYFVNKEVPPGELTWTVPGDMDFGEVKTPVFQAQNRFLQAQQNQKDWQIVVSDTRTKNRNQWDITAQLTTPLHNSDNQLPENILKFKSADGKAQDLSQASQIYQSDASPPLDVTSVTWNSTSGFYLDLISNGNYPVGKYNGTVTFTLRTTP